MNKVDLIEAVHGVIGGTKVQAEQAVEKIIESIIGALKSGQEVSIAGLGIFSAKERKARTARTTNRRSNSSSCNASSLNSALQRV